MPMVSFHPRLKVDWVAGIWMQDDADGERFDLFLASLTLIATSLRRLFYHIWSVDALRRLNKREKLLVGHLNG